jgi:ADP-ribosylglycohydrolase
MTDSAVHTILGALYCFLKSPFDFEKAVQNALRCGGEVRTIAALVGACSGALLGVGALPSVLVESVIDGAEIGERADRLFSSWQEANGPFEEADPASGED